MIERVTEHRATENKEYQEYPGPFQHGMWLWLLKEAGGGGRGGGGRGVAPEKAVHPKVDAFVATHQAVN